MHTDLDAVTKIIAVIRTFTFKTKNKNSKCYSICLIIILYLFSLVLLHVLKTIKFCFFDNSKILFME